MQKGGKDVSGRIKAAVWRRLDSVLDNMSLKRKLILIYLACVLLPLFLTDGMILTILLKAEADSQQQEMKNTAEAIAYNLNDTVENAVQLARNIYSNRYVNEFLDREYATPLAYFNAYLALMEDSLYKAGVGSRDVSSVIYADNPTIINGGFFARVDSVRETEWYQAAQASPVDTMLFPWYERNSGSVYGNQKKLSLLQKMDYYHKGKSGNVLRLDLNYGVIIRNMVNNHYASVVYVCSEDKILFSNDGRGGTGTPFEKPGEELKKRAGVQSRMQLYGQTWTIYVMKPPLATAQVIRENFWMILFLLWVNIVMPLVFMQIFRRSFVLRLQTLGNAFEGQDADHLPPLTQEAGRDEIGILMRSYNRMADRINELIQTVYKDKLREQEMDIAKQQAELLALHSQINPHFLFNALESIRMHSILKGEQETAEMVERLALMQRQNVEWGNDSVPVAEEIRFVQAYLELQKYRFGERLSYAVHIDPDCETVRLPKLTLVTFVENACVHGIEEKTAPGWIFVRGYREEQEICFEIEDTGMGMSEAQVYELQDKMNGARIGQLKEKGRVGILNACLRLKMVTDGRVRFDLESEQGAGTLVSIRIQDPERHSPENGEGDREKNA